MLRLDGKDYWGERSNLRLYMGLGVRRILLYIVSLLFSNITLQIPLIIIVSITPEQRQQLLQEHDASNRRRSGGGGRREHEINRRSGLMKLHSVKFDPQDNDNETDDSPQDDDDMFGAPLVGPVKRRTSKKKKEKRDNRKKKNNPEQNDVPNRRGSIEILSRRGSLHEGSLRSILSSEVENDHEFDKSFDPEAFITDLLKDSDTGKDNVDIKKLSSSGSGGKSEEWVPWPSSSKRRLLRSSYTSSMSSGVSSSTQDDDYDDDEDDETGESEVSTRQSSLESEDSIRQLSLKTEESAKQLGDNTTAPPSSSSRDHYADEEHGDDNDSGFLAWPSSPNDPDQDIVIAKDDRGEEWFAKNSGVILPALPQRPPRRASITRARAA